MKFSRLRPMKASDLPAVMRIQRAAYGDAYQESAAVLGRKLELAPDGCWLAERGGEPAAYVFAHPWRADAPPPLHAPLAALPDQADCVFMHDLAVAPSARGGGVAAGLLRGVAGWASRQGARSLNLVALADAAAFWARHGFTPVPGGEDLAAGYGAGALFMRRAVHTPGASTHGSA